MNNIADFIKTKRKKLGLSQKQLAHKLSVTEKKIINWESGNHTPSPSERIHIAKVFSIPVSTIIGEESKIYAKGKASYHEPSKQRRSHFFTILCYAISVFVFFIYLKLAYTKTNIHYFIQLLFIFIASFFAILGSLFYAKNDLKKIKKRTYMILFIYYCTLLLNTALFTRTTYVKSYNLIPFKTLLEICKNTSSYGIFINIIGNFIIFMPLEYFLLTLFSIRGWKKNFGVSFLLLLVLEMMQYILKRGVFDVDDILLCVSGMMFFYFIYNYFWKIKEVRKQN